MKIAYLMFVLWGVWLFFDGIVKIIQAIKGKL